MGNLVELSGFSTGTDSGENFSCYAKYLLNFKPLWV
jgi:hypothetical protein